MLDINNQEAYKSHLEAEKAYEKTNSVDYSSQINSLDLDFYKKVHEAAVEARKELETLQAKIREQENKAVYTNGALSAFSEFIQHKYNISKEDSVDSETGKITRK